MSAALPLHAETAVALANPLEIMARLRDHFIEHGVVSGTDGRWTVTFDIGTAEAIADDGAIRFRVAAADSTSLAYLQWGVAEHVCEFVPGETPQIV